MLKSITTFVEDLQAKDRYTFTQTEQDLVLSRALVELYGNASIARTVAFRGGTALHKLFFSNPGRYSEDIDLVQIGAGPIGPILDAIRASLPKRL